MKHKTIIILLFMISIIMNSCNHMNKKKEVNDKENNDTFSFLIDRFADIKIMQYQVPEWDKLSLQQKKLVYYLSQAALSGRDIIWDQNYKYNLVIRRILENIIEHYKGDRNSKEWQEFMIYVKRVWFANGIHHHYSSEKMLPNFNKDYFINLIKNSPNSNWPLLENENLQQLIDKIVPIIFDPNVDSKKVNTKEGEDLI